MEQPIIQVKGIKKRYRMGQIGGGTLTADLQSLWAKITKKPDPNLPIGQDARLVGKSFMALNGVDFSINKGEAVGIIGVNGAGKSTLLKIISRITAPTDGEIILRGRIASMLEVGTGFNPEMTGRENVYMNGAILGMTKEEITSKIEQIIDFSEVREFIDTPVKRYSSGMYVKLAFAVAAHLDSEIMIMDEVLAVGDAKFQKKCLDKMSDAANQDGRTILYVSHNMATIRQLCNRVIVLKEGRVIFDGEVEEAIRWYSEENYKFVLTQDLNRDEEYIDTHEATIKKLIITNKDLLAFKAEENIDIDIHWYCKKATKDLMFRACFVAFGITPIGLCCTQPFDASSNTEYITHLTIPTQNLAPGKYSIDLYLNVGNNPNHDFVVKAFSFEITANNNMNSIAQWYNGWGQVAFPTITHNTEEN